ncbi:MAG TPA: bifunctional biotin--[acetyl-CoA-carboxylase] ligase/biotin operon repressor BirA [Gammaproteobacteria bacterium]|nr:bifunctional biotin--[acetyl-CoA-carboxylase] ligase/biotin operon repressor BirA [Gammaproteobacteria bacterium]
MTGPDVATTGKARHTIIRMLADGHFHSGTVLAAALGVSRGAIWKRVQTLAGYGLDIERVPGRGYRLAAPLDLLDAPVLQAELARADAPPLHSLDVLPVVDSTNRWLLARAGGLPPGAAAACLAECQTAGRGRRGRAWVSPFGVNLYLSVAWHLQDLPPNVGALSLVAGLATAGALEDRGFAGVGVKWPNDLVHEGRKLGGILVDLHGQPGGACRLVIGVGINIAMPPAAGAAIDQPWIDLQAMGPVATGLRNRLGGRLIAGLLAAVEQFTADGFDPFLDEWSRRDAVSGSEVELRMPDQTLVGAALGVDSQGALRLRTGGEIRRCFSGEVSLRSRPQ